MLRFAFLCLVLLSGCAHLKTPPLKTEQSPILESALFPKQNFSFTNFSKKYKNHDDKILFMIGINHYYGNSVKQNFEKAYTYFLKASEKRDDNAWAQFALGLMNDFGQGRKKSYKEALSWYIKAAKNNLNEARYNLALLYYYGDGLKRNFIRSHNLLKKAAKENYAPAQEALKKLDFKDYEMKKSWRHIQAFQGLS